MDRSTSPSGQLFRRSGWKMAALLAFIHIGASDAYGQVAGVYADTLTGSQPFVLRPFVIPGSESITVGNAPLDTSGYTIDYRFGRLWIPRIGPGDTALVTYQTWNLGLQDSYARVFAQHSEANGDSAAAPLQGITGLPARTPLRLQRSGSITRGILAGNNRDAIIESGLRLQMGGEIAEDVRVQAMLTDESVPILPEGTTQRLSELDRVYISIDAPQGQVELGDFEVRFEESTFARFGRKVQGVGISASAPIARANFQSRAIGATARGIFRTQDIPIVDGVQGPYRLEGSANERFIFVVPGSESVYLDGDLLTRGDTQDYIIDYATGELTFTANHLMRDHYRVAVEFQYRTTEFTRTLVASDAEVTLGRGASGEPRVRLGASFLREADGRSFDQEFGLTADDQVLLEMLGDDMAQKSGATQVTYDAEAPYVQYVRRDTIIAGQVHEVYAAVERTPTTPVYRVLFTRVGQVAGDYVRQGRTTNGLVYVYRGPNLGEYAPVRILPRPVQQRMVDLRGRVVPVKHVEIYGEWAQSLYDRNRFSSLDAEDNLAQAYTAGVRLGELPVGLGTASVAASRRLTQQDFATFGRVQPVEFYREWNLPRSRSTIQGTREVIDEADATWHLTNRSEVQGSVGRILQGEAFSGTRQVLEVHVNEERMPRVTYELISIRTEELPQTGRWVRQDARSEQPMFGGRFVPALNVSYGRRSQRMADSLVSPSSHKLEIGPEATWRSSWGEVGARLDSRTRDYLDQGIFRPGSRAYTLGMHFNVRPSRKWSTEGRLGWRKRTYTEYFRTTRGWTDQNSLVLRWTGRAYPWQRALQMSWFYEALSERTPVLQEIYLRTGPELGEYVWVDANDNGVIELDEFIPETTQDEGTYARTLIPSDSLQSVTGLQARFSLMVDFGRRWRTATSGLRRHLRHVALRTSLQVQEKSRTPELADVYLLRLGRFRNPEHTLKGILNLGQDLWLFRGNRRYGLDASWRVLRAQSELAAGTESSASDTWRLQTRWAPASGWGLRLGAARYHKTTNSESFASRTYDIRTSELLPEISFQATSRLSFTLSTALARKRTETRGTAVLWKVPLEARYSQASRLNITGRFEVADVRLQEDQRTTGLAHFELTDGRGEGTSLMWRLDAWMQLSRVMRATLTYTGRSPEDAPSVHTIRMQLGASF